MSPALKGIVLMLISTLFFSAMNALIKYLNILGYSSMENVFFRAFFMVASLYFLIVFHPLLHTLLPKIQKPNLRAKKKGGFGSILLRSFFGGISVSIAYYNFTTIPLGLAMAFLQSAPIFMVLFSFFRANKPSLFSLAATLIGFFGVLLIANPQTSDIPLLNAIIGIIGAMSAAFAFLTIPTLRQFYSSEAIVWWYGIALCILGLFGIFSPIEKMGGWTWPDVFAWILFALTGITGALGQWLMTKSYLFAPPSVVAPIAYMRIVWSLWLGILLGDAWPNALSSLGMLLIITSGILIALPAIKQARIF